MTSNSRFRGSIARWLRSQTTFAIIFLAIFAVFAFWYYEGNNFTDGNIPGIYVADNSGRSNVLFLRRDHSYEQSALANGKRSVASGKWRLMGNADAHIVFEGSFLDAPAAAVGRDDHYAFGMFDNLFGYLTLTLQSDTTPLIFRKKHLFF